MCGFVCVCAWVRGAWFMRSRRCCYYSCLCVSVRLFSASGFDPVCVCRKIRFGIARAVLMACLTHGRAALRAFCAGATQSSGNGGGLAPEAAARMSELAHREGINESYLYFWWWWWCDSGRVFASLCVCRVPEPNNCSICVCCACINHLQRT